MHPIQLLSSETINLIAAGEVIERPASVVKELTENAVDAGATAVTVEIRGGGTRSIRVTDNGSGIPAEEVRTAFLRHATSKLTDASELSGIRSLGFRGEALASIAAAARTEIYTRPAGQLVGIHRVCEGEQELLFEEIGIPAGTTVIAEDLFSRTPARRKFLRSERSEANAVAELLTRLSLSRPEISFRLVSDGKEILNTSGNGQLADVIYQLFGREAAGQLIPVSQEGTRFTVTGFIGSPQLTRGNRGQEYFFVDGRAITSRLLSSAVEEGYSGFIMQHRFPFAVLFFSFETGSVDVNVHPAKAEVRFDDDRTLSEDVSRIVSTVLSGREDIFSTAPGAEEKEKPALLPRGAEPFETARLSEIKETLGRRLEQDSPYHRVYTAPDPSVLAVHERTAPSHEPSPAAEPSPAPAPPFIPTPSGEQLRFLSEEAAARHRIIGQYLGTYWLVEYDEKLYIIDQHAAHEKVLYERKMKELHSHAASSQSISPPVVVTLSPSEETAFLSGADAFRSLGYEIEPFGGRDYMITAIPTDFPSIDPKDLFLSVLSDFQQERGSRDSELLTEKIASMSCKAAVKGNTRLSFAEADALIKELLSLDNPYHCPHGRPTIIVMNRYEIERKFKRIV